MLPGYKTNIKFPFCVTEPTTLSQYAKGQTKLVPQPWPECNLSHYCLITVMSQVIHSLSSDKYLATLAAINQK